MKAKSAFGTQAHKNDCRLRQSVAALTLGAGALLVANLSSGPSTNDYDISADIFAATTTSAPMTSIHGPSR